MIAPLKVLQSLKDSPAIPDDEKYSFVRKLSPETATHYNFTNKEVLVLVSERLNFWFS